jgi:hypothetical protein
MFPPGDVALGVDSNDLIVVLAPFSTSATELEKIPRNPQIRRQSAQRPVF